METNVIQRINEETDIVALAQEFMSLTKRGKNYMGLCPFHDEKTPSFSVSPEKKLAKCMGCGKGGNALTFYQQVKNISVGEAISDLAARLGIEHRREKKIVNPNQNLYDLMKEASTFYQFALMNSEKGSEAYRYLIDRGLTEEDIKHFEIGFSPTKKDALYQLLKSKSFSVTDMMSLGLVKQNEEGEYYDVFRTRIMFPIKDQLGNYVGFSGRATEKDEVAKYVNSSESIIFKKGELLYHYLESKRPAVKQKHVILAEGFFDIIQTFKSGLEAVVATMGTALTKNQAELIKRLTDHVVIAYDGDKAGLQATLKAIPLLRKEGLKISILQLPNGLDPDEFIKKYDHKTYRNLFETDLIDPYQFGFNLFKAKKDFAKADDITLFKKQMSDLLKGADQTILDFYQRKIFDELKIKLFISDILVELPVKKKAEIKAVISKAERSFAMLLINLLKERRYLDKIQYHLTLLDIYAKEQRELYKDICNYYVVNDIEKMDIDAFLNGYTKNHDAVKKYMSTIEYQKNILINSDKDFEKYIEAIKAYENIVELNQLKLKIEQSVLPEDRAELLSKYHEVSKRGKVS